MRTGIKAKALLAMALALQSTPLWAADANVNVGVGANIPLKVELTIKRDAGSTSNGAINQLAFTRDDRADMGANGSPNEMYLPLRSETGKNYHVLDVFSNGATSFKLSAKVTGNAANGQPMARYLRVWCGGFWEQDPANPQASRVIEGTASTAWNFLDGFERSMTNRAVDADVPMNYQLALNGGGVPLTAGNHTGQVTWTAFGA